MKRSFESGNALFFILIAVVMLAALSFAVMQGSRGGAESLSAEKTRLVATEILEYADVVAKAVAQTRLRGFEDTQISFENSAVGGYANANCTDEQCKIFSPSGGGVNYIAPNAEGLDQASAAATTFVNAANLYGQWFFPRRTCVRNVGIGSNDCAGNGLDDAELMIVLPWVKQEVCIKINDLLGVDNPSGSPPSVGGSTFLGEKFQGNYNPLATNLALALENTSACFYHSSLNAGPGLGYFYYKVLIAR